MAKLICSFNVKITSGETQVCYDTTGFTTMYVDGIEQSVSTGYTFSTTGEHTVEFVLADEMLIGNSAFKNCYELNNVVIPSSVTSIDDSAFESCYSADFEYENIDSITYIGNYAFNATKVSSLPIGSGLTYIGNSAFANCYSLTGDLVIPDSVITIGEQAFYYCYNLTSLSLGSGLTTIGAQAFYQCRKLEGDLIIPDSVTTIGISAFSDCKKLSSITFGEGLLTVNMNAFENCTGLTEMKSLATTAPVIYDETFKGISSGGSFYYPKGSDYSQWINLLDDYDWTAIAINTGDIPEEPEEPDDPLGTTLYCIYNIDTNTSFTTICGDISNYKSMFIDGVEMEPYERHFFNTTGFHTIEFELIDDTVISEKAFSHIEELSSITIPRTITTIGNSAFTNCTYVEFEYEDKDSITYIGDYAFYGTDPTEIPLGRSLTYIGDYAFSDCDDLTGDLVIPDSVTTIGNRAFYKCTGFTSLTLGSGLTTIGNEAFSNCNGLTSIVIPDLVTSIGDYAFGECFGLTSLSLGSGLTTIGNNAFWKCRGLTGLLVIPDLVTSIGDYAFYECTGLTSVSLGDGLISIGKSAFGWCTGLTGELVFLNSVTSIGNFAFSGCEGLTSLVIPSSVTSIGQQAFRDCQNINEVISYGNPPAQLGPNAFYNLALEGTLYIPKGADYSPWREDPYCWFYCNNWRIIEMGADDPDVPNETIFITYNVTSTTEGIKICYDTDSFSDILYNGVSIGLRTEYYFRSLGEHTLEFVLKDNIIGNVAFYRCYGITNVVIPDSVTSIGEYAFNQCSGLTSLSLGSGLETIGNDAFHSCSGLTSIGIPDSVTSIGSGAFHSCSGLTSIELGSGLETIDNYAFSFCSGLTSIELGSGLETIDNYAFSFCSGLTEITSNAVTAPTISNNTFNSVATGGTLYYPEGSDYSQWLSTDEYYLGFYGWNGVPIGDEPVVPPTPDEPDTGDTPTIVVSPFVTEVDVNYDGTPDMSEGNKIRVGYSGATPDEPDIFGEWIVLENVTEVQGVFYGFDKVMEYEFHFDINDTTDERTGEVAFGADGVKEFVHFRQDGNPNVEPDEPDVPPTPDEPEPELPEDSKEVTYSPIWKDVEYVFVDDSEYGIYYDRIRYFQGQMFVDEILLFKGKAYLPPDNNVVKVSINKICQNYMSENPNIFDGAVGYSHSYNEFKLKDSYGTLLHTYRFVNDWSYKELSLGIKTSPIIPNIADGQKLFFSVFATDKKAVKWGMKYYDGTADYNNTEYVTDDFTTVMVAESRQKFVNAFYFGDKTYISLPRCECKYVLYYMNPYGGYDWLPITGKVVRKDKVEAFVYTKNYNNTTADFGKNRYLSNITVSYNLNTGWLTQEQSDRMWELLESNTVWLHSLDEDRIYPVMITDTDIEHKQKFGRKKRLSYSINVELSQTRERL